MQLNKHDEKWITNLEKLERFLDEKKRFPAQSEMYEEVDLGRWFSWQRIYFKRGALSKERTEALDKLHPAWKERKKSRDENILFDSGWKDDLTEEQVPIDKYYKDEKDIYICLKNGIKDIRTLMERYDSQLRLSHYDRNECYELLYPYWSAEYGDLLLMIRGASRNVADAFDEIESTAFLSKQQMCETMEKVLTSTLSSMEEDLIRRRFAIPPYEKKHTHQETAKACSLTDKEAKNIEAKAMRKLRHPVQQNRIYNTGTDLEKLQISQHTKNSLFRKGINSVEKYEQLAAEIDLAEWLTAGMKEDILKERAAYRKKLEEKNKRKEPTDLTEEVYKRLANVEIEALNLSFLTCNAAKRRGLNKVLDIFAYGTEPEELINNLKKLKHMTEKRAVEIASKAIEFKNHYEMLCNIKRRLEKEHNEAVERRKKQFKEFGISEEVCEVLSYTVIEELDLSRRTYNPAKQAGINTVMDIFINYGIEREELQTNIKGIRNMGEKSATEIACKALNFKEKLIKEKNDD